MNQPAYQHVKELFLEIRDLDEAARGVRLDRAAPQLRTEVLELLAIHDAGGGAFAPASRPFPTAVGGYEILSVLGSGGMGVVYRARQASPRREVALKVMRQGFFARALLERFRHEAEILGRLQHPGIALIHEAGVWDAGAGAQPFFVMELVNGECLTEFGARRAIGRDARLELMAKVCDAVEHAHQKGVIHRDLKPANIMITSDGEPKILDFGVARLTNSDLCLSTLHTEVGQLIGTAPYMSPEQVVGDAEQTDTRSDVFSLGVTLYELLTGVLPHRLDGKSLPEAARMICEEAPVPLSTVAPELRGDLETIVHKALEKDRDRRYGSAAMLAADLRRYLNDEPILARPATTAYQIRKFARRNKGLVAALSMSLIILVAGVVVSMTFAVQAGQRSRHSDAAMRALLGTMMQIDRTPIRHTFQAALLEARRTDQDDLDQIARDLIRVYDESVGRNTPGVVGCLAELFDLLYYELDRPPQALEVAEEMLRRLEAQDVDGPEWAESRTRAVFSAAIAYAAVGDADRALAMHKRYTANWPPGFRRRLVRTLEEAGALAAARQVQSAIIDQVAETWGDASGPAALARFQYAALGGDDRPPREGPRPPGAAADPVAHWTADGSPNDSRGDHHGRLENGAAFAAGRVGQAFAFDGVDDCVNLGASPLFEPRPGVGLALTMWVQPKRTGESHLAGKRNGCGFDRDWYQLNLVLPAPHDRWRHLAFVVLDDTGWIYMDGYLWTVFPIGYVGNKAPLLLGNSGDCWAAFAGLMDDVKCFDRALSADEIADLYREERNAE